MNDYSGLINDRIEALRPKLQDTTRRNPLINNVLSAKSASFVRIVDEKPQSILKSIVENDSGSMRLVPLPPVDLDPPDEDTTEFRNAFQSAQATDEKHLKKIEEIDFEYDEKAPDKQERADRELKDRIREMLDMPPRPQSEQFSDLINHAKSHGINPSSILPSPNAVADDDRFDDDALQTLLLPKTFQSRLSRILSKARMYQEERGLDVVYIVLGYLKWTLPNAEKQDEFKSPLILLPVSLTKSKSTDGEIYTVRKLGEPIFNPSLAHKLSAEAGIDLSEIHELSSQSNLDIENLFGRVAELKPRNMQWSVLREASFGVYPFQGIELFYDLDTTECDFSEFPIVSELMLGKGPNGDSASGAFSEEDVESELGQALVPHTVLDADSSQFIALLKVANDENVALEGPPGSGKSQTIVNAIANAIYSGKRVLFVAQKVTALEVVFSRLQSLGLEHFVLPMMGGYGSTEDFYEAVKNRLELEAPRSSQDLATLKRKFELQRDKLAAYIDVLTKPVPGSGMSVHQVLGLSIANDNLIKKLPLELKAVDITPSNYASNFGQQDLESASEQIEEWCKRLQQSQIPEESIWYGTDASIINTDEINTALVESKQPLLAFAGSIQTLDEQSKTLLKLYLENTFEDLLTELVKADADENLKSVNSLIEKHGEDKIGSSLEILIAVIDELGVFKTQLKIGDQQLSNLSESTSELELLRDFCEQYKLTKCSIGLASKTLDVLSSRSFALKKLLGYEEHLSSAVGTEISPATALDYRSLLDKQEPFIRFRDYLRVKGFSGAEGEIRNARTIFRKVKQTFRENQLAPQGQLKKLRDTIQGAGFFSFLSSDIKNARLSIADLLQDINPKDPKNRMLDAIDEALGILKQWSVLELSDHFEQLDGTVDQLMSDFLVSIEETTALNSKHNLPESVAIKLLGYEALAEVTDFISKVKTRDLSWDALRTLDNDIDTQLEELKHTLSALEKAEQLVAELKHEKAVDLPELIEVSKQADMLLSRRRENIKVFQGAADERDIYSLYEAFKNYTSMSETAKALTFSTSGHVVLTLLSQHRQSLEQINNCARTLLKAKAAATDDSNPINLSRCIYLLEKHRQDQAGLNNLITRRAIFSEAKSLGFGELLRKLGKLSSAQPLRELAKAGIISSLVDCVHRDFGAKLLEFDGTSLTSARKLLQQLDRRIIEISPSEVTANALRNANPPEGNSYGRKSEFTESALLKHELQKQRRTPPRKVLKRARNALLELFPCWMMVPTAVAQHLGRGPIFDLVIIDEASQMTPENSISALMRGKNALIAGDTNQLPPTNFFKGLSNDEDEDEDVSTTEESILELANIQFHPKHRLLWHYRSRHEDLIAFSNHYVYDSELVIFPSPNPTTEGLGISLVQVNGTFQRGVNPAEAQVMLDAIVQFMKTTPERSLGVAVMNQSQMEQLETMVLREAESNKAVTAYLEKWSTEREGLEKFFVKNLENVQGDERDVMFIGTVYGRDPQGKFYQRFGPINGPAGKRRLNVLFSRAKEQIVTFSSIPLSDFNPSPTNEGATLLRRWLEFSATKRLGEISHSHDRAGHTDSPFEDHVIEAVKSLGYEAVPQVGVSSYFIDIGVKHPTYPLGYICGIECDGASYHSSKSARDRDRLREEVLNRLGWDLYRIWSTDWFRDPLACRELLKEYLDDRLAKVIEEIPEGYVHPADLDAETPVFLDGETTSITDTDTEDQQPRDPIDDEPYIKIGTKFSLRYLDGPRAGAVAKFWFQQQTNDPSYHLDGYTTVGNDSPLGEAVEGAEVGEINSYPHGNQEVRVEILGIEVADD